MRKLVSQSIVSAGLLGVIAALWQIVRFFQGSIGVAQPFAILEEYLSMGLGQSVVGHYVFGVVSWIVVAGVVAGIAFAMGRIVDVGWHQFLAEQKAAHEANVRLQKIEDAREQRIAARSRLSADERRRLARLEQRVAELESTRR